MAKLEADHAYSDEVLLRLYRECLARISVRGQDYMLNGVRYTSLDVEKVFRIITNLENKIAAATGGMAFVPAYLRGRYG